jgi:PIN domain nuclease of toxin-antitoxin system
MKILLDTHTFIWFVMGNTKISAVARTLIEADNNEKIVSTASLWEIAVKLSIGKLNLALSFDEFVSKQLYGNGFDLLKIETGHISSVSTLPLHHRDPFDRLLIAQAIVENIPVVSADKAFDSYAINRLW